MKIYLVYERNYADYDGLFDDKVYINSAYKSKKKAMRKAKNLLKEAKSKNDDETKNTCEYYMMYITEPHNKK